MTDLARMKEMGVSAEWLAHIEREGSFTLAWQSKNVPPKHKLWMAAKMAKPWGPAHQQILRCFHRRLEKEPISPPVIHHLRWLGHGTGRTSGYERAHARSLFAAALINAYKKKPVLDAEETASSLAEQMMVLGCDMQMAALELYLLALVERPSPDIVERACELIAPLLGEAADITNGDIEQEIERPELP